MALCCPLLIVLFLSSCNDDESAPTSTVFVVAERSTGKLFILDKTSAIKTETGAAVTLAGGDALTNIRGMVFDPSTKKIFASTTTQGGGKLYAINPATMTATLINDNTENDWYGVADLKITSTKNIIASLYFHDGSTLGYGPGFITFDHTGTVLDEVHFSESSINTGMGIVDGSITDQFLVASWSLEIYTADTEGNTELLGSLTPVGFEIEGPEKFTIQNMVKDNKGVIFGIVYCFDNGNTYLAKVDLANEQLINIGQINDEESEDEESEERYMGLMLLSKDWL